VKYNKISEHIKNYAESINFSGDISLYRKNETIFHQAFGYRDRANCIANTTDTRFGIASGTKLFTALGILKLVDQGHISLDTTPSSLLKEDLSFIDKKATIKHLLCHTSGIYDYYDEDVIKDFDTFKIAIPWNELETPSDYLPLFSGQKPKFPAGSGVSYSNGGYVFLAYLIEHVTGKLYRDFIEGEILKPLGMHRSGFYAFDKLPENTAWGYIHDGDSFETNIYQLPIRGGGDGGMYTTGEDLHMFWNNLFTAQIISKETLNLMTTKHSSLWENSSSYGLGIYLLHDGTYPGYYITGVDAGVGFHSRFIPGTGININIFSNMTNGHAGIVKEIQTKNYMRQ
jgi:CubicO group peptidase (beta-lactamase class C family)